MFEVTVVHANGHREAYALNCPMDDIVTTLQDAYYVNLDDILVMYILKLSSAADIRQGKVR